MKKEKVIIKILLQDKERADLFDGSPVSMEVNNPTSHVVFCVFDGIQKYIINSWP